MRKNRYKKPKRKLKLLAYAMLPFAFNYYPTKSLHEAPKPETKVQAMKKSALEAMVDESYFKLLDTEGKKKYAKNAVKRINAVDHLIRKYAIMYGIGDYVDVMKALAFKETKGFHYGLITKKVGRNQYEWSYEPDKISRGASGEIGLYQIMPRNAKWLKVNPYNLEENVKGATKLFSMYLKMFDYNLPLALNAYNVGPGNMKKIIAKAKSKNFTEYVELVQDPKLKKQLQSYVLEVLAARRLFNRF